MRTEKHNSRRGTNGKPIKGKHNDRNFDVSNAPHIDGEKTNQNQHWLIKDDAILRYTPLELQQKGITLDTFEQKFYEKKFSEALEEKNAKYIKNRHKEKVQTMEEARTQNRLWCAEETIFQIGKHGNAVDAQTLSKCYEVFLKWEMKTFPNIKILDSSLHLDEDEPHIHQRRVWVAHDDNGHLYPCEKDALKEMEIERPDLSKKEGRKNNAKMTQTRMEREKWLDILEEHGIEIEREPALDGGKPFAKYKVDEAIRQRDEAYKERDEALKKVEEAEAELAVINARYEALEQQYHNVTEQVKAFTEKQSQLQQAVDSMSAFIAGKENIPKRPETPEKPTICADPRLTGIAKIKEKAENDKLLKEWQKECAVVTQRQAEWDALWKPIEEAAKLKSHLERELQNNKALEQQLIDKQTEITALKNENISLKAQIKKLKAKQAVDKAKAVDADRKSRGYNPALVQSSMSDYTEAVLDSEREMQEQTTVTKDAVSKTKPNATVKPVGKVGKERKDKDVNTVEM